MANPPPQNGKYYTPTDPAMDKYRPARDTLMANTFVNNPNLSDLDRIYLRGIQGTYKVKLEPWADRGHVFQIMLVWDYDRIWGSFDFGSYKGTLQVDHGPDREPPEFSREDDSDEDEEIEPEPTYFDFTWRGTCSHMPDTIINNSLITKGKIAFGPCDISGYFEGPIADSNPEGRCNFDGEPLRGHDEWRALFNRSSTTGMSSTFWKMMRRSAKSHSHKSEPMIPWRLCVQTFGIHGLSIC